MYLRNLQLKNFRNIKSLSVSFNKGVTIFIGNNGEGKTSLLEAVFCLANGASFRTNKSEHLVTKGESYSLSQGEAQNKNLFNKLALRISEGKRSFSLNGKKVSAVKLPPLFPTVLFSPESLAAIKEGPEIRRNLIDDLLVTMSQENSQLCNDYAKCLKMRNKILRDYKNEVVDRSTCMDVLESINGSFLPLATKLSLARVNALQQISKEFSQATRVILGKDDVDLSVEYVVSGEFAGDWDQKKLYYALLKRGQELLDSEMDSGMTLIGPHRHDIRFLFEKTDSRYYCSQGQQRALILAFKIAQIMYYYRVNQDYPLLLLDDVLSELDPEKRSNLVNYMKKLNAQIILTSTDLDFKRDFSAGDVDVYKLSQGEVFEHDE